MTSALVVIAAEGDGRRDRQVAGMSYTDAYLIDPHFTCNACDCAGKLDDGLAQRIINRLDVGPGDTVLPTGAKHLHNSLLDRETAAESFRLVAVAAAVLQFPFGKNAFEKTRSMVSPQFFYAATIHQINAMTNNFHCSAFRNRRVRRALPAIVTPTIKTIRTTRRFSSSLRPLRLCVSLAPLLLFFVVKLFFWFFSLCSWSLRGLVVKENSRSIHQNRVT